MKYMHAVQRIMQYVNIIVLYFVGTRVGTALKDPSTPALNLNAGSTPMMPHRGQKQQADVSPAYALRGENKNVPKENTPPVTPPPLAEGKSEKEDGYVLCVGLFEAL